MGCDESVFGGKVDVVRFNPRTRMGCDQVVQDSEHWRLVSIHAPAWGATVYSAIS